MNSFAVLDLTSGCQSQASIAEHDQNDTSFITHRVIYKLNRVPWVYNGPHSANFEYFKYGDQRVNTAFNFPELVQQILEVYLDDHHHDHLDRYNQRAYLKLQKIFDQLTDHNITLSPVARNVSSRRSQVEYVGHVINQYLSPFSKAKLDKVDTFEKPDTIKKLKRFYALLRTFGIIESS